MHVGAVHFAHVALEVLAVSAAENVVRSAENAHAGHAASAAEFDVIAAREGHFTGLLLLVEPPRHVHVHAADAIVIGRRQIFEDRQIAVDRRADGVHDVLADHARTVGDAVGEQAGFGVEHDARGFAATGGEHDHARVDGDFAARLGVDVGDAAGAAIGADHHFAAHGAGADLEVPGLQGGRDVAAGGSEVGVDRAGAPALGAIVAGGPAVERPGEDGEARGDAGNLELVGDLLDDALVSARRGRGLEAPVGGVFQAFLAAEDADQFLGLVVVGRQVVVGDGPVTAFSIAGVGLEIVGAHAEGDAAVVVGAPAQHARAIPPEFAAGASRVGFAGDLPAADQG